MTRVLVFFTLVAFSSVEGLGVSRSPPAAGVVITLGGATSFSLSWGDGMRVAFLLGLGSGVGLSLGLWLVLRCLCRGGDAPRYGVRLAGYEVCQWSDKKHIRGCTFYDLRRKEH